MNLSIIPALVIALFLQTTQVQFKQLVGTWQLVHFSKIEKIKSSPQYQTASPAMRQGLEYKIQNRLENTVYQFVEADSLLYTDFVNADIVQKKAVIKIDKDNVMSITDGNSTKKAKIISIGEHQLVIEPISENSEGDRLIFERIK